MPYNYVSRKRGMQLYAISGRLAYAPFPHMEISFASETIGRLGPLPITNTLIMSWITMGILFVGGLAATYNPKLIPGKIQNITEALIEAALNFFTDVVGSRKEAEKIFPIVFTFFIFILLSNWLGLLPGIGTIGFEEHIAPSAETAKASTRFIPFLRSTYSDLNMTLALAILSVSIVHIMGISALGFFKHAGKFISFKGPIDFFVGLLESIAEVAKIISFSFRLFGNIFAGEVLLVVILTLVPYIAPVPFFAMELFVGFIQALVFSMLTLVFIKVAITETEHS